MRFTITDKNGKEVLSIKETWEFNEMENIPPLVKFDLKIDPAFVTATDTEYHSIIQIPDKYSMEISDWLPSNISRAIEEIIRKEKFGFISVDEFIIESIRRNLVFYSGR